MQILKSSFKTRVNNLPYFFYFKIKSQSYVKMILTGIELFFVFWLSMLMIGIAAIPLTDEHAVSEAAVPSVIEQIPITPTLNRRRRNASKRHQRKRNKKVPNAGKNFSGKPKSPELKPPKSESKYCSSNCESKRKRHI